MDVKLSLTFVEEWRL